MFLFKTTTNRPPPPPTHYHIYSIQTLKPQPITKLFMTTPSVTFKFHTKDIHLKHVLLISNYQFYHLTLVASMNYYLKKIC